MATNNMEIDLKKFRRSLQNLPIPDAELQECLRLWPNMTEAFVDKALQLLSEKLLDPQCTSAIRDNFPDLLLLIVTKSCAVDSAHANHVIKCVALSKLIKKSQHIRKFAQKFFATSPAPFNVELKSPTAKRAKSANIISDLEIIKCCQRFLECDAVFYKSKWNWSEFIRRYSNTGCDVQRLYCNSILSTLSNMSAQQRRHLNANIDQTAIVRRALMDRDDDVVAGRPNEATVAEDDSEVDADEAQLYTLSLNSDIVTSVEGVMLPIFDLANFRHHHQRNARTGITGRMVLVESTRTNLRSLALGISSDRAICLSGPVGCGKTSLVEYVAKLTGRIALPWDTVVSAGDGANGVDDVRVSGDERKSGKKAKKRKNAAAATEKNSEVIAVQKAGPPKNGFLRIQLGDQTDSKTLLGQYRCTDVPGEFIWQAGALTQAVMYGYWLLLEDIDLATQDVTVVLTNLLENNTLSVPGLNDAVRISPDFQLFVTLRNQKQSNCTQQSNLQMLNKYMYVVNMLPLGATELVSMVNEMYPRFQTVDRGIVERMVKVFLKFSCGDHDSAAVDDVVNTDDATAEQQQPNDTNSVARSTLHSNRLVSTRDLLKWCTRSYTTFADTSEANRFLVLKNAVDLFCGYLPDAQKRTMINQIGVELNISIGMCETFAAEHLPRVQVTSEEITVGRVVLAKHTLSNATAESKPKRAASGDAAGNGQGDKAQTPKKQKTDVATYVNVFQVNKQKAPTFSFTRPACCIMERIAVAVQQNEPVLLVGETGVGKTSSVQYLAYHTNHKMVVVNMNNQSDVSDLIGGFKPVDFAFVLAPLRTEFEALFKLTFNAAKNEKFLNHLSVAFTRSEFVVLIKLMLRIIRTVVTKDTEADAKRTSVASTTAATLSRWHELNVKLLKLEAQLRKSLNISFAFIAGSLVNCIQNGDWVLLDEINLASAETLECLSTILEPNGSVVLLEKGDLVPVQRHPDFRIFACMNPSTDVGKKELPVGIRNRFTEFYADELTELSDLEILIRDYLINSGIPAAKLSGIARMYEKLRQLARLDLNDGLGNRPVFSLRTLCRALTVCARNLCGSVDRNLYESFCMSFLTQLDPASHAVVLQLIQRTMLSNVRAVLQQPIPRPPTGEHINFEGYWIETGSRPLQSCDNYILTDSVRLNLKDLARIVSIGRLPVLLQGPTSAGKTSLIDYVARRSGNCCLRINNHEHTDLQEYIGTYTADADGKLRFREGVLVEAMRHGHWIILDELNLASSDILEALNRVLDDNRELFIAETQTLVRAHPNFMLFATQNPPGLYGGRKALSRAFKNRFIELHFAEIPRAELEVILEKRCLIPKSYAHKMVKTMSELHINRKTTVKSAFTLRDLFRWGQRYTLADPALLADSRYDWNQHLVDEGYLALSAKIRDDDEVRVIEDTLFANFRKRIELQHLFELSDNTSMVTKDILERIAAHPKFERIVWTFNMRRMAVLAAKALQFNEPVLLVGSTGCGKTTVCQILADIAGRELRILNCHMHTEGADFLGGLRPYRGGDDADEQSQKLFEWANGPLVLSMQAGSYFLADEISLAEDSVLERLNCILEPERTVLLSEKGGGDEEASDLIVTAVDGFQFLATMNPGGDFGKKELSPALRNRFTEIWCRATDSKEDMCRIAEHLLRTHFDVLHDARVTSLMQDIAACVVDSVFYMRATFEKFHFSIRDVLAWIEYVAKHARLQQRGTLSLAEALMFGMETMFLDALEMLPHENVAEVEKWRAQALQFLVGQLRGRLQLTVEGVAEIQAKKGAVVELDAQRFGIQPFYLDRAPNAPLNTETGSFVFTAPTTQRNLFCLLSALSVHKPILLEGPPGVGKTSLIEQVTGALGYEIVRINLCEHTDLADLFGSDLPATSETSDGVASEDQGDRVGSFVWRDGPLLAALKAPNTWILLDELNLAPQSVLEGLNAVLDHRGEVYIPELNKTFRLGAATRIFASQNPLKQGGGRKGLPQSFLNRFTKVYLRKLQSADLRHVVRTKYAQFFDACQPNFDRVDLCDAMVAFTECLDAGIGNFEFGYKGGPFEVNLRDILRWCEFLNNAHTGLNVGATPAAGDEFMRVVYEKMKLVYCQRMRTPADVTYILNAFQRIFQCDTERLEQAAQDISLYWTDSAVYLDDIRCTAEVAVAGEHVEALRDAKTHSSAVPLMLSSQREMLKSMAECMILQKPVILCGPTDCGKTKLIDVLCTLINRGSVVDTIDDSVTGSFQQIDLNRHLEEIAVCLEEHLIARVQFYALNAPDSDSNRATIVRLLASWENYTQITDSLRDDDSTTNPQTTAASADVILFKKRLQRLTSAFTVIDSLSGPQRNVAQLQHIGTQLANLARVVQHAITLNSGGHFEWVDSKIVTSLKFGRIVCLEHVNLCSSAILDRLNPMFEADGSLLLAEKGVSADDQPEIVRKHPNFNAFLTLDPKNGEISRAMRNRCIELNINREAYNDDDLKALVFAAGVHEMHLIRGILRIHQLCREVSDFSTMGVAHITKCAYLVARNRQLGASDVEALSRSAVEVYVRSASVDLSGFGLGFYRGQLRQAIAEVVDNLQTSVDLFDYDNVCVAANELNALTLVRRQCEVFLTCVRGLMVSPEKVHDELVGLFGAFDGVDLNVDELLCRLMLHIIYTCASATDLEQRRIYLNASFDRMRAAHPGHPLIDAMHQLNEQLFTDIRSNALVPLCGDLPWNVQIFPRLQRHYGPDAGMPAAQRRLSGLLIARVFLDDIRTGTTTKLSQIDALTFSWSVQTRKLQNVANNELIQHLHSYLTQIKPHLVEVLGQDAWELSAEELAELVCAYLWHNRLYACAQRQLFANKRIDDALVNTIAMHVKWLEKHLLAKLPQQVPQGAFAKTRTSMSNIVAVSQHPLHRLRKQFVKHMTNFLPYFDEHRIDLHRKTETIRRETALTPALGAPFEKEIVHQRLALLSDEHVIALKSHLAATQSDALAVEHLSHTQNVAIGDASECPLSQSVARFVQLLNSVRSTDDSGTFNLEDSFEYFTQQLQHTDAKPNLLAAELMPMREYYALKALNVVLLSKSEQRTLNRRFFEATQSLGVKELQLFNHISAEDFVACEQLWHDVWQAIGDGQSMESVVARLPTDFYRNYASFRRSLTADLQAFAMNSLATRRCVDSDTTVSESLWSGPIFTAAALAALFDRSGHAKACGLVELENWQSTLQQFSQLLWTNVNMFQTDFQFEHANIHSSYSRSCQLLSELGPYVAAYSGPHATTVGDEFISDFAKLSDTLERLNERAKPYVNQDSSATDGTYSQRANLIHLAASINTIVGAIEMNLLTHLPLLDPVEKNRLKQQYAAEEQSHLRQLLGSIECMQITMSYRGLGSEYAATYSDRMKSALDQTNVPRVPLRPSECAYSGLMKDITHFIQTCCQPRALLDLYSAAEANLSNDGSMPPPSNSMERIKRIELWINNSSQFVHHTLAKYAPYYMDFLRPIQNSVVMLTHGLCGLKHCLLQLQVLPLLEIERSGPIDMLGNLVEFPSVDGLRILPSSRETSSCGAGIARILAKSERFDAQYFSLLKVKLREVENQITLTGRITDDHLNELNHLLSLFNGVWKQQEDARRQRLAEDESLYVTKTRCEEDDEDEVAIREVRSMFPNTIDDDFGDLMDAVTLEQKPERPTKKSAHAADLLQNADVSQICLSIANIMSQYSRSYYYAPKAGDAAIAKAASDFDYVRDYKHKFDVFVELFPKFRNGLNSAIDESTYNGVSLLVGANMQDVNMIKLNDAANVSYDFYKDANIAEVITCSDVLKKVEARANVELAQYPEHAGLLDIISIIKRIQAFSTTSPVVRFSSGFQILNKKVNEWNKLAHRGNTMIDLEVELGSYIQRWMKLELQCWRECLSQSFEKIQSKAHRYWFFIYNLTQEYLSSDRTKNLLDCDVTDFKQVEKHFDETDTSTTVNEVNFAGDRLKSKDVINVLKQFIESANYADFAVRMRILKTFEQYLYLFRCDESVTKRKNTLVTILHNIHMYFEQFGADVDAKLKAVRAGVDKKLKEFVKMESYSKYLSYFSQDASIAQVHRKLHKFLKEYEQQIGEKLSAVFVLKETQIADAMDGGVDRTKAKPVRNANKQPSSTLHIIDVQHFVCAKKKSDYFEAVAALDLPSTQLLLKAEKLFATSRNIVKHAILHSQYPTLIHNLHTLVDDHIESLQYLRQLEVDRTQEKPKQKVQAKQHLQQKRKALTDFYKVLTRLGFSYRAGLMEAGLSGELTDLKIAPFCVRTMIAAAASDRTRRFEPALLALDENVDRYYAKSVYKLKLLQSVLLQPHADIGLQHLDRIKGFTVDMFLLVQQQRKSLSSFVSQLNDLCTHVRNVVALQACIGQDAEAESSSGSFEKRRSKYEQMRIDLATVCDTIQQYQLLFKCAPISSDAKHTVLTGCEQPADQYPLIRRHCSDILQQAGALLNDLSKFEASVFIASSITERLEDQYNTVRETIDQLVSAFALDANESLVHGRAVHQLRAQLQRSAEQWNDDGTSVANDADSADEFDSTSVEIENIIHSMLYSMQSIYKKHSDYELETGLSADAAQKPLTTADDATTDLNDDPIELNHLKVLVTHTMQTDLDALNVHKVTGKLANVLLTIQHSSSGVGRRTAAQKIIAVLPILEQYQQLCMFYLIQQLSAHKVSGKMLAIVSTVFVELGVKGFCVPPDLQSDEDGDAGENKEEKGSEGFGLEDGTGEKDVSDKLESEDQLDSAKKPGDDKETDDKEDADCKEEKGIDMSDDFDSKLQDLEKKEPTSDSDDSDDDEEADKQMGETEDGAEKLDDQIWGSDEEKDEEEETNEDMNDEDEGKGSKDEDEVHNDLANQNNETTQGDEDEQRDGLDAADNEQQEKKKKEKDIDTLDEPDVGDDQANPYHNDLEEPPEPEDVDLGDNFNLDKEDGNDNEDRPEENPFDIDTMKDQMDVDDAADDDEENPDDHEKNKDQEQGDESDSGEEDTDNAKPDDKSAPEEEIPADEEQDTPADTACPAPPEDDPAGDQQETPEPEAPETPAETPQKSEDDGRQAKDKPTKEENAQSMPDERKNQGSMDQVQQNTQTDEQQTQQDDMDAQDTGEDNQAIGQAENDESKSGHQGIAEAKETNSTDREDKSKDVQEKRKQGNTDEERTLGDPEQREKRQLKTIDKTNTAESEDKAQDDNHPDDQDEEQAEEYQHVREAKASDKTTLDNATEEQSKRMQHEDQAEEDPMDVDTAAEEDQLIDDAEQPAAEEPVEELRTEEMDGHSDKPATKRDRAREEQVDPTETEVEVEGDYVDTMNVPRAAESSAHCAMELLQDKEAATEPTTLEQLEMRQMFEKERMSTRLVPTTSADFDAWQSISNRMLPNARELCEQLRLILEPTKCTRLKGDYRTGRRINLKKIIPYIASQFRKDKIWLRRTKPAQRDYKITVAIDDSKSMAHNNSKVLTLEAISLVSQALTLLESGRLSIVSFGEQPQIILNHSEQFDGPKLCGALRFDQNQSRIAEMLHFARVAGSEDGGSSSDNGIFENLLLILSDGRNIFSEGEAMVRNAVKLARMQRIFIVYIIIDNPENKNSILDIRVPIFAADRKSMTFKSYLDTFPFPYYVIVRDLAQLPLVLSDAMRQWFELVNSEQ